MNLKEGVLQDIKYTKQSGETTERTIIPTIVPPSCVDAIDVTELDNADRQLMRKAVVQYLEYVANNISSLYNFEDWADHSGIDILEPKYRRFNSNQIIT